MQEASCFGLRAVREDVSEQSTARAKAGLGGCGLCPALGHQVPWLEQPATGPVLGGVPLCQSQFLSMTQAAPT